MIVDLIHADHVAAREMMAVAGNAEEPADAERVDEFARLAELWQAHGAMMEGVVYPALEGVVDPAVLGAARGLQQEVVGRIAELAAGSGQSDERWPEAFVLMKETFERQCGLESAELTPLILSALEASAVAAMTRRARALRQSGDGPSG